MKKILITGVAGFIGSNLADRFLREGYAVVGLDNLSQGVAEQVPEGVEFHKLDVRSKDIYPFFKGIDVVFHLAAKNSLSDCQEAPYETIDNNVLGTANVFEASRLANVPKVVYAQSSAIEEGEKRARGFYAVSKICDEIIAEAYMQGFGLKTVGVRYFNVYGPRQDYRRTSPPIMSKFIINLLKGQQPVMFEGDDQNKRDFIYVDDINDFHLLCIEDPRTDNGVFRLGSGMNYSIREVYDFIKDIIGVNPEPIMKPRPSGDPIVQTLADITETKKLGWAPKTDLKDGLRAMVAYIKAEIEGGSI